MKDLGIDLTMDSENLYVEESFTDMKVGTIRRLTPVMSDGSPDENRQPMFLGHTQLMSPNGPVPVSCEIEADTLPQAMERFPRAITREVERIVEEAQQAQRAQQQQQKGRTDSGIIIPGR
ncbi:MAG: cytoplasmic protein [Desulfobacterales bacterium]|jgi:hypothetical protein